MTPHYLFSVNKFENTQNARHTNTPTPPNATMSFPDIRTKYKDEEELAMVVLVKNWPCLPGRGAEKTAGFDCAVILLRTIWAMFMPKDRPKKDQDDDAIERYIWATFERMETGYEDKLKTMRSAAFADIVKQTGEKSPTFS